jgi:Type II secretion system (T2SS), protein M subtype b
LAGFGVLAYHWYRNRVVWPATILLCAGMLGMALIALSFGRQWWAEGASVQQQINLKGVTAPLSVDQSAGDFTHTLAAGDPTSAFLLEIDRAAQAAKLSFVSSTIAPASVAAGQLRRTEITVRLRGSYPALKQVFKEVLERFPHTTVTLLRLSTTGAGAAPDATQGAAEAVWVVSLWSARRGALPQDAGAEGSTGR